MKIVFMGTPEFALPSLEAAHKHFQVQVVYTQPDRPSGRGLETLPSAVKKRALELGLSVRQPVKLSQEGEFEYLKSLNPDAILVVAYGQILKTNVLQLPRLGCFNIHSSLLPRWRGAAPIQWSILSGDLFAGVTSMKLVQQLDAGDIALQSSTKILDEDNAKTLHDRLAIMGGELILPTLQGVNDGTLKLFAQDITKVTYASKLTKEMEILDPYHFGAHELELKNRALFPWPGTSIILNTGNRIKIKQCRHDLNLNIRAGTVCEIQGGIYLGTISGSLQLLRVQQEGKKEVSAEDWANGLKGQNLTLPFDVKQT